MSVESELNFRMLLCLWKSIKSRMAKMEFPFFDIVRGTLWLGEHGVWPEWAEGVPFNFVEVVSTSTSWLPNVSEEIDLLKQYNTFTVTKGNRQTQFIADKEPEQLRATFLCIYLPKSTLSLIRCYHPRHFLHTNHFDKKRRRSWVS